MALSVHWLFFGAATFWTILTPTEGFGLNFRFTEPIAITSDRPTEHGETADDNESEWSEDQSLSLEDLKTSGAKQSRFRDLKPVGSESHAKPEPDLVGFEAEIAPILLNACVDCHGPEIQEGNLRIDSLNPNLFSGNDVDWWTEVYAALGKGEMPPANSVEISDADRAKIIQWLSNELQLASTVRRQAGSQSAFRRMTRYEYNYALQDLLGLPWEFAKELPPEAQSDDGFQNNSALLHMSVMQFETHHRLARQALSRATVRGEPPEPLFWSIDMLQMSKQEWPQKAAALEELKLAHQENPTKLQLEIAKLEETYKQPHSSTYYRDLTSGYTAAATWEYYEARHAIAPVDHLPQPPASSTHEAILPGGVQAWLNIELGNQLPDDGNLRVRVRASRTATADQTMPSMQLYFGWQASNEGRALLRVSQEDAVIDASPDQPKSYQWDIPLGEIYPRNSVRKSSPMGAMPSPSEYIRLVNSSASPCDIRIDYVEVAAPVYDSWPPASHKQIFLESANASDEMDSAREIIETFMARAWRRPISQEMLDNKLQLFKSLRGDCDHFEEAVIEVLATVIASPQFLYLGNEAIHPQSNATTMTETTPTIDASLSKQSSSKNLSAYELATRLSIFLWCSIPDNELLRLADEGSLSDPKVIASQVQRMLADPRSKRLSKQFVDQWLDMQSLDFLNISQNVPDFDPLLKEAMRHEPVALFEEILTHNENVLDFIHADYTMANERLAMHYGLSGVYGNHFRRVPLDGDFRRGGLLTQAGPLMMNSDYPDSHPLKRGVWLLERILNDPPPPPPPAVPQIDLANPEIAKMTLKERIEDHRNQPACNGCHMKIDPWGIAFENFDALGRWRDEANGKAVDASSDLPNHKTLDGMDGLKRFLLAYRQDQFVQALVHKMATFAMGRPLKFDDRAQLDAIIARVRQQGDRLGDLVESIATSELFRSK